jgi:hypothetical protein
MAGLLVACGFWGTGSTDQPNYGDIPELGEDKVVYIGHLFHKLDHWITYLKRLKFKVELIIMARNPYTQRKSRVKASAGTDEEAAARYDLDYRTAFYLAYRRRMPFTVVTYEALTQEGGADAVLAHLGLTRTEPLFVQHEETDIRDENAKWLTSFGGPKKATDSRTENTNTDTTTGPSS